MKNFNSVDIETICETIIVVILIIACAYMETH